MNSAAQRPRVLMLCPVVPGPYRGRRPYNFLRALASQFEFRVLALPYQRSGPADAEALRRELDLDVRLLPQSKAASLLRCALFPLRPRVPLRALYCGHPHIARALRKEADAFRPSVIHLDRLRLAQFAAAAGDCPVLVDLPDALAMYYERLLQLSGAPHQQWLARLERARIQRYEHDVLPRLDATVTCSAIDAAYVARSAPNARIEVITNAVDTTQFAPVDPQATPPRLVFSGTLSYAPNLDGLRWYLEQVVPRLRALDFQQPVRIAGVSWNARAVERVLRGHDIEQLGFVERMADVLNTNDIYLCPLRAGAGVRNKLLEAMACGMACVSTTLGAEGLQVTNGQQLRMADTPEAFAQAVRELAGDRAQRRSLGQAARTYVEHNHDLRSAGECLAALYRALGGRRPFTQVDDRELLTQRSRLLHPQ